MGSASRKLRRLALQKREFVLEGEDAPTLIGRIRKVSLGAMLSKTGAVESKYRAVFEGNLSPEERREMTPSYADDPEGFEAFVATGKRMAEAYLVLGIEELRDEDGDPLTLTFSDDDAFTDDSTITVSELKAIYAPEDIDAINKTVQKLSNGTVTGGGVANSKTFQKAVAHPALRRENLRN